MRGYEDRGSTTSYIYKDGKVQEAEGSISVMISSSSDLTGLAAKVGVGTIAYTSGWQAAWQLGLDGSTWTQFIGGGS